MPKYVYETLDSAGAVVRTFEVWQGINEPALSADPESGGPVRRIITGTNIGSAGKSGEPARAPKACGPRCGCH